MRISHLILKERFVMKMTFIAFFFAETNKKSWSRPNPH